MYKQRVSRVVSRLKASTIALLFVGTQIIAPIALGATANADAAATLEQCRNGSITTPAVCDDNGGGNLGWVSGNAGASDSHWREGDSIAYRMIFSGLTNGTHTVTIQWDTTKTGVHAIDYLTTYNRTEQNAAPCTTTVGCDPSVSPSTIHIPTDTNAKNQISGDFTLFGGNLTSTGAAPYYTVSGLYSGTSSTSITITFTSTTPNPVLAWGGHIASQNDWGPGLSASAISGSPYHMRLLDFDGSGGNQDRSLAASAVFPTPAIATQASTASVILGNTVTDTATITGVKANTPLSGTVTFYTCGPSATNPTCTTANSTKFGSPVTITPGTGYVGTATSAPFQPSQSGNYCFFVEFVPSADSPYSPFNSTDQTNECFNVYIPASTITIIKDAQPNDSQVFNFSTSGGLSTDANGFGLSDTGVGTSNTKTFNNVAPGVYTVTESTTTGWDFKSLSCGAATNVSVNGATATITISGGQSVVCTYTNAKQGTITVYKTTNPANDKTKFNINASKSSGNIIESGTQQVSTDAPFTYHVSQGTYSVSEDLSSTPGWSKDDSACASIVVSANNLNPTCTITNTKLAMLKIVKTTNPSSSSQAFVFGASSPTGSITQQNGSFMLDTDASTSTYKDNYQYTDLMPGAYNVTETEPASWKLTNLVCTDGTYTWPGNTQTLSLNLAAGADVTCTFTNTQLVTISGYKYEVNANGSTVNPLQNWTISLLVNGNVTATTTTAADGSYSFSGLLPGSFSLTEGQQVGFTQIYGQAYATPFNVVAGGTYTDKNFGNFKNATISGSKFNDLNGNGVWNAGEPALSGWTITIYNNGGAGFNNQVAQTTTNANGNYSFSNLAPDTYKICETNQAGWTQTYPITNGGCQIVTVDLSGHDYTHTDFGNQGRGTISVVKNVDSNGDGTVDYTDVTNWNWDINGTGNYLTGSANHQNVAAGTYTVSEQQKTNYHVTASSCTDETVPGKPTTSLSATVSPGENVVCTFTNTRDTGSLTLIKHVSNTHGGTADASAFNLHVTQNGNDVVGSPAAGSETGTSYALTTGTYTVSEDAPIAGYEQLSIVCDGQNQNSVDVTSGTTKTCTITNGDIAPQLTVIKHVINDNSGTSKASDFTMNVTGTNVSSTSFPGAENPGTTVTLNAGSYSVDETANAGYNKSLSTDCSGTIAIGQTKTCTITNNDVAHPNIHVVKSGPATAHEGDTVTYNFAVTNIGDTATLSNVSVSDDIAGTATYVSGDTNNDHLLQKSETWTFQATYKIPAGQTANVVNTATACGYDSAQTKVCDTDTHTLDVLHPAITVKKSGPLYGYEGQTIGYTFVVTNTGDTALSNLYIDDNIANLEHCDATTLAIGASTNCTASFLIPTPQTDNVVNVVTAYGTDSLGKTVTAMDDHTLDVLHPAIHVVKSGPATAHEGDKVTYTFTVTNTGDIPLSSLTVNDNLAGIGTYVSGDTNANSMLDTTETWIYTKQYTIPTPQVADVVNTVTACGLDPIQANAEVPVATCDTDTHTLDVLHPAITVKKSGPLYGYEGETIGYTFVVKNTGDTPLSNVYIDDNIAMLEHCDDATLAVGASTNCTASFLIPTPQTNNVVNVVTAYGTDSLDKTVTAQDDHTLDVIHPAINVVKYGPKTAYEGDTVTYTFVVTNTGDIPLSDLTVNDNIAGDGVYQYGDTNENGLLDLEETWVYSKTYTIPSPQVADVVNTVTACGLDPIQANSEEPEATCGTDTHTLDVLHPAIHVVKSGPATAHEGDNVTYTFTVTNTGDTPLSFLTVSDNVAGDGVYVSGDSNDNNMLDLEETWIYTVDYTIPEGQVADVVNTVTACGLDPIQARLLNQESFISEGEQEVPVQTCDTDTHTLDVLHPAIHVEKTANVDSARVGTTVTYTFTVTNTGDTPLSGLTVLDSIIGAGAYQSGDTNNNKLLDLTETWIYTATYVVPATAPAGSTITNTVTVCGDDSLEQNVCDTDQHNLTVTPEPLVNTGTSLTTMQLFLPIGLILAAGIARRFSSHAKASK